MQTTISDHRVAQLSNAGLSQTEVEVWIEGLDGLSLPPESDPARLDSDAALECHESERLNSVSAVSDS